MAIGLSLALALFALQDDLPTTWPNTREEWVEASKQQEALAIAIETIGDQKFGRKKWSDDLLEDVRTSYRLSNAAALQCMKFEVRQNARTSEPADVIVSAAFGACVSFSDTQRHFMSLIYKAHGVAPNRETIQATLDRSNSEWRNVLLNDLLSARRGK